MSEHTALSPNLVCLTGYPKSGNTWVSLMITSYLQGGRLNRLEDWLQVFRSRLDYQWYSQLTGINFFDLTHSARKCIEPAALKKHAIQTASLWWLHTHDAYRLTPDRAPPFPADILHKVILIVRDPADIVVSLAAYLGTTIDRAVSRLCDEESVFVQRGMRGAHTKYETGSWTTFTSSWLDSALPLHIVRYEDLLEQPQDELRSLLIAIGLTPDEALLNKTVQSTSFEILRQREETSGYAGAPTAGDAFFREGKAGLGYELLSKDQQNAVLKACGTLATTLGYPIRKGKT